MYSKMHDTWMNELTCMDELLNTCACCFGPNYVTKTISNKLVKVSTSMKQVHALQQCTKRKSLWNSSITTEPVMYHRSKYKIED